MSKSSLKINFLLNIAYQLLKIALPLLTVPYLSRVLLSDGIGQYSFTYSISDYFVLAGMLGLNQYGNRAIARVRDSKDERSRVFCSIYCMQFIWAFVVVLAYVFWALWGSGSYRTLAMAWILSVSADLFDISWFFFGMEEFKLTVTRNIILKLFSLVLIFQFVRGPNDVAVYCGITSLNFFLTAIALWPFVFKRISFYKPSLEEVLAHIKPNLLLFAPVVAISLYTQMDKILLGVLSTSQQVGFYDYSEKLSKIPLALITALGTVMLPRMSGVIAMGNTTGASRYLNLSFNLAIIMAMGFAFGIASISDVFVPIFFGAGWDECILLMALLSGIIPVVATSNVLGVQYLIPCGKDKQYTISVFIGAVVNIALNVALVPVMDALGSVIAVLIAEFSVLLCQALMVNKAIQINAWLLPSICSAGSGLIMYIAVKSISYFLPEVSLSVLIIKVIVGVLVYVVLSCCWMRYFGNPILDSVSNSIKRMTKRYQH